MYKIKLKKNGNISFFSFRSYWDFRLFIIRHCGFDMLSRINLYHDDDSTVLYIFNVGTDLVEMEVFLSLPF